MWPKKRLSSGKNGVASVAEPAVKGETAPPVPVAVGIGGSAGGYEPLEHIFITIPPDCDLSFVVVMHLPPEGPPLLADLIRRYTTMEVLTAEHGMSLRPNTVYVIPPGRELTLSGGRLQLHDLEEWKGKPNHSIDRFFTSLAADLGARAIAVLLSGFGLDGSEGVRRIKEGGGIVLVQDPETAVNHQDCSAQKLCRRLRAEAGGGGGKDPGGTLRAPLPDRQREVRDASRLHQDAALP